MKRDGAIGERAPAGKSRRERSRAGSFVHNKSGSTLMMVMVFAVVMLISAMAVMEIGAQDAALAIRDARASQAFYNAEAGVERGESWIKGQSSLPVSQMNPFSDSPESFGGGLYQVTVTPDNSGSRTVYTVTSYATVNGRSRAVEVDVTPTAVTDYLYFTNRNVGPGSPGFFRPGEIIDGPVHVNDEMAIWGDPVFTGKVESTASTIYYNNNYSPTSIGALSNPPHDTPDFQEGCELGASDIPWLQQSDVTTIGNLAGLSLSNKKIVFGRDDGSGPMLGWLSHSKTNKNEWTDVELSSFNGIIYVNGSCWVEGIVDGQVTLISNGQMDITGDLIVADSDANGPRQGCDDLIGLVVGSKLNVVDNAANQSDCVIHAHMMAINNQSCLVDSYSSGSPRGLLTVYGGMAQDKWGPVGTGYYDAYDVFHVLTGYERDFHYDWRLRTLLPPGYSSIVFKGGGLERLAWREITPIDLESYGS
jgi:Tfp pilus assembly protein PilX